jgi:DNA polymerase-3 subunit gamma/tau
MVLIRLCHVADLPPPGELVRRLQASPPAPNPGVSAPSAGPGGGARAASGGGAARALPAPSPSAAPVLASFRDVLALASAERELMLHSHLLHSVHLVRWAPPVIELRPHADAPRDLASKLGALLLRATGTRWTIAIATQGGEATLAEQGSAADRQRRDAAHEHPLVRAIMEAFPGARLEAVRDPSADAYGLPALAGTETPGYTQDGYTDDDELVEPPDLMDAPIEVEARFLTETSR